MKKCTICSEENPDIAKYCFICGNPFEIETIQCSNCSAENPKDAVQCFQCGQVFARVETSHNELLGQWRFTYKLGKYLYVSCDNCLKSFKIEYERCVEKDDGYTIDPPEKCPACGVVSDTIYYAGTEPMFSNAMRKAEQEQKAAILRKGKLNRVVLILNIIFLIVVACLGFRGWVRGDFKPKPTPTLIPTRTPRPTPTRRPLIYRSTEETEKKEASLQNENDTGILNTSVIDYASARVEIYGSLFPLNDSYNVPVGIYPSLYNKP